jgi:hypothetical protein
MFEKSFCYLERKDKSSFSISLFFAELVKKTQGWYLAE